jgi:hypothetical protein
MRQTERSIRRATPLGGWAALGLGLLLATGCTSTSPSGAEVTTSLTVKGKPLGEIRVAAIEVFQKAGYEVKSAFGRNLVFEQYGGKMNSMLYGGWMDPSVWIRVKLHIEELQTETNILECNVFRVKNRGDSILEEETRARGKSSKPFKKMLRDIQARLEAPPGSPAKPTPAPGTSTH